jgi:phi13 family phage major tail protein
MEKEYGIPVGITNFHIAKVTKNDRTGLEHDTPKPAFNVVTVQPTIEFSGTALDASNKRIRSDREPTAVRLAFVVDRIDPVIEAEVLGHRVDTNGVMIVSESDEAPEYAVLYERTLDNGKVQFICYPVGKFEEPTGNQETRRKGTKNYQTTNLEFYATLPDNGELYYKMSEETPGYSETTAAAWYTEVYKPVAGNLGSTTTP